MRNFFNGILILLVGILFYGCDKIEGPNGSQYDDLSNINTGQKVFIEEFTGHTCGNCPAGALEIKKLLEKYPDQLIAASVHIGFFAKTNKSPYTYDFNTEAGAEMDNLFKIDASGGYPSAFVNRETINGTKIVNKSSWSSEISKILATLPTFKIDIKNSYSESANEVTSKVIVTALKSVNIENLNLVVYLTEDSVVQWQKDYTKTEDDIQFYVHNHVLRQCPTGPLGVALGNKTLIKNEVVEKTFTNKLERISTVTKVPQTFRVKHCSVIAFVADKNSYSIKQVGEEKVIQ